jgi:hypothetical protein
MKQLTTIKDQPLGEFNSKIECFNEARRLGYWSIKVNGKTYSHGDIQIPHPSNHNYNAANEELYALALSRFDADDLHDLLANNETANHLLTVGVTESYWNKLSDIASREVTP